MSDSPPKQDLERLIKENYDRYAETQGVLPERLTAVGKQYHTQGYFTQQQLYEIARESSTRSAHYVNDNPPQRCRTVTANLTQVEDDFSRIRLLTGLTGFQAPTASCVLTAIDPETHAVVDTRVWASLERLGYVEERKEQFDAADYERMMGPIRELAQTVDRTPAIVGYALFAYDAHVREGTLH